MSRAQTDLPDDALPGNFGKIVKGYAAAEQVRREMTAVYALGWASAATRGEIHALSLTGWDAGPATLYAIVLAASGERKSTICDALGRPFLRAENLVIAGVIDRNLIDEEEMSRAAAARRAGDDPFDKPAKRRGRPPKSEETLTLRPVPALLMKSATAEAINRRAAEQGGPIAFVHGEAPVLSDLLGSTRGAAVFSTLCDLYDGAPIDDDRITRGSVRISRATATLVVGTQPGNLRLDDDRIGASGFLARCFLSIPTSLRRQRNHRLAKTVDAEIAATWADIIAKIHARGWESFESSSAAWAYDRRQRIKRETDDGEPAAGVDPGLLCSEEAGELLLDFMQSIEDGDEGGALLPALERIPGWMEKAHQRAIRVAALIELINTAASARTISAQSMGAAIAFTRYFMNRAVLAMAVIHGNDCGDDVRALRAIVASGQTGVTGREIQRTTRINSDRVLMEIAPRLQASGEIVIVAEKVSAGVAGTGNRQRYIATDDGIARIKEIDPPAPPKLKAVGG